MTREANDAPSGPAGRRVRGERGHVRLIGAGVAQAGGHTSYAGTFQSKPVCASNDHPASGVEPTYSTCYHYWD